MRPVPERLLADRRGVLRFAVAGACLAAAGSLTRPTWAAETAAHFAVMRSGDRIGEGRVVYQREGDALRVRVAMEAKVKFGFVTLFRYRHESEELWRDGRLAALDGRTDDDGKEYHMTARPSANGLAVEGTKGSFTAPADVLPLSYWHPDTVNQSLLLDASKGRLIAVDFVAGARETIDTDRRDVLARRYDTAGDLKFSLWYDTLGAWVRTRIKKKGSDIDLVLDEAPIFAAGMLAPAVTQDWATLGAATSLASYPSAY
ncbi:MAG: DUF6134 family protein [Alphaproteobacteria bacterium]